MKYFFVFAPMFHELPLAIIRELKKRDSEAQFCGLSTGSKEIYNNVYACNAPVIRPLDWIDNMEREWLSKKPDKSILEGYERKFGTKAIKNLVIADRQIGNGFVNGVIKSNTILMERVKDQEELRNYVVGLLDYCNDVLAVEKPDVVFCYTVAGAVAYALSITCKHLGIPFLRISSARIKSRFLVESSTDVQLESMHENFFSSLENNNYQEKEYIEAREYITAFRERPQKYNASRKIHERYLNQYRLASILKQSILDAKIILYSFVKKFDREIRKAGTVNTCLTRLRTNLNARGIINSNIFDENIEKSQRPLVFFPLHVNPEASTMVQSPMHTNQLAVIEALAKSIPLSMDLIVKEHMPMLGKRPVGFYEEIKRMPGVKLISPTENSFNYISRAKLVCSITSTVAWEAIILKRPTLIIGSPYFIGLGKGFIHCPELNRLPDAVEEAFTVDPVDDERLEIYIKSILDTTFDMPIEIYMGGVKKELVEKNNSVVIKICNEITQRVSNTFVKST